MNRLSLLALVAAASFAQAQSYYMPRCPAPIDFPPPSIELPPEDGYGLNWEDPWICVLPPPEEFTPWEIGPNGEIVYFPIDPAFEVYPPIYTRLGEDEYVMDYSDDYDVQLVESSFLGSKLVRLSTGETDPLPMVAASSLVPEGMIAPAVMVELYGNAVSGDGNVVIGNTAMYSQPFRYRAWGTGGLEFLQVPADTWASAQPVDLSRNGDVVIGSAIHATMGNEQAVRWNKAGELIVLNPAHTADTGSYAHLINPAGTAIAGDVYSLTGSGVVPFLWNESDGFQQLGDPNASDNQVLVQTLSEDGLVLTGARYEVDGTSAQWYWTKEEGFKDIEIVICDFAGDPAEDYSITGIDLVRRVFVGNFADGRQFLSYDGVTISPEEWMSSVAGPIGTLRSAAAISSQTMEGAHHRPIRSLAFPGRNEFAWVTGDLGKATRQRDAVQSAGEFGYGVRVGSDAVLGIAFGYSDLDQDYAAGSDRGSGSIQAGFAAVDLGFTAGPGELTLTGFVSRSDISTQRGDSFGKTEGAAYSIRVRYDNPLGKVGQSPIGVFAAVTFDHSDINGYTETGGIAPAAYVGQSNDSLVGRLGLTGKLALGDATDLSLTAEVAKMFNENRDDFAGTDVATGVLDFTMPDVRTRKTWGRLGLDLDHRLSADTVVSLTLHASTQGDAFDTAAALSIRRGF